MKLLTRLRELRMQNNTYFAGAYDNLNEISDEEEVVEQMGVGATTSYDLIRLNIEKETFHTRHRLKK